MNRLLSYISWPVVCGVLLALLLVQQFPQLVGGQRPAQPAITLQTVPPQTTEQGFRSSYSSAVLTAAPAVVNIYTTKIADETNPLLPQNEMEGLRGYDGIPRNRRMQSSLGSGVIMSPEGYILTNSHVIKEASTIIVALRDGRDTRARVIGDDPETDLAVLKIELDNLPTITLANSSSARVGDVVLAIGNPFGVGQTVTMGIVSATGRNELNINTYEDFIQTDAAINPGNSGGALVNAEGHLLGINAAIFSRSGGSQGIGFAIPTDLARSVMLSIIKQGRVIRGWLGIEAQPLTPELAESFGISLRDGILISGVYKNSPASKAGLQRGDVIIAINGVEAGDGRTVMDQVARQRPGEQVVIKVLRQSEEHTLTTVVGERPRILTP
ncbi:S1C family serine protease [Aestuariirhabdus litorea]|uniref:PDZ domain-containing protein n=1 Tax=Aestuariirhabdus litorea TaxID=2528527 RepID=A0A3P3VLX4_9GAMM|nr:trypsin-like peptidase domain-containing protein [Aestuariirhabdus litorea]RRJ83735.1 PDZ domain-containing protein [Aestuariirhabdus litorea]RWW96958.1 PDZ domain-containing protein [Endozoicomonadaceae bacterium GTF-13]